MSFRVYNSGNMLVLTNTDTWRVEKFPVDKCWYKYNATDAPILYSLYYGNPERDLIIDQPYTSFENEDGSSFVSDADLQGHLDIVLGISSESAGGIVSDINSTTTLLTASSSFTGEWVDVATYNSVIVAVNTDQNGSFAVEFSPDGVNIDSTLTRYYRTNQIEAPHRFTVTRRYARIVFTNTSSTDQTFIRLQTIFGDKSDLNAPVDSTLAQDFDAIVSRPTDYHTEVALGLRQGAETWNKFGYNSDVDDGDGDQIIASWGGAYEFLTTGETISIVSTDNNDKSGNSGVNSVIVYGVDENWNSQISVYLMDGTTPVVSADNWIGVNRVAVFLSGTGRVNAGTINVTASSSGYTMAQMPMGGGVTQQMIFFVPDGYMFLAEWLHFDALKIAGGGGNPEITVKGQVYSAVNNTDQEVFRGHIDTTNSNNLAVEPPVPFPVGERSILYFTASTDKDNTSVTGRFSGELFRDKDQ